MIDFILKYWLEFLFGFVISIIGLLYKKINTYQKTIHSTTEGVKGLLKSELIRKYKECKEIKSISLYEKQAIDTLYGDYKNLGGNGFIDDLMKEIEKIPLNNCGGD